MGEVRHPWAKNRNRRRQELSRSRVLDCIAAADFPLSPESIARRLELPQQVQALLMNVLSELTSRNEVVKLPSGYRLFEPSRVIRGSIKTLRSGAGFILTPEGQPDGHLASTAMAGLFDGDEVTGYRLSDVGMGDKVDAMVFSVLSAPPPVIGMLQIQDDRYVVDPLYATGSHPVEVPYADPELVNSLVIARVNRRPRKAGGLARGTIIDSFGPADTPGLASRVAQFRYGLPSEFEPDVLDSLKKLQGVSARNRVDLTHLDFVTVDDDRARDLDDAVASVSDEETGAISVYVAIADAAQLLPEGSPLDRAARQRGTSVYFPGATLPMLPPALSEDRLSLLPGAVRPAIVAEFRIVAGRVQSVDFHEALIQSRMRLNYDYVSGLIAGRDPKKIGVSILKSLEGVINGAKVLDVGVGEGMHGGDAELRVDPSSGEVTSVSVSRVTPAHQVISQWMVATNRAVADFLTARNLPAVFRVQSCPEPRAWREIRQILREENIRLPAISDLNSVRRAFRLVEKHVRGAELAREISQRMPPAQYALQAGPHARMGEGAYVHFTSPIRRYADLVNHRSLKSALRGRAPIQIPPTIAEEINDVNRRVKLAERDVTRKLLCDFVEDKGYEVLSGTITKVTDFGCFVVLDGYPGLDCLMHISRIGEEAYIHDPASRTLTGSTSKVCFHEGMRTRVRIGEISPWDGRISLDGAHHEPLSLEKRRQARPDEGPESPFS